jgi:hypothetical protein
MAKTKTLLKTKMMVKRGRGRPPKNKNKNKVPPAVPIPQEQENNSNDGSDVDDDGSDVDDIDATHKKKNTAANDDAHYYYDNEEMEYLKTVSFKIRQRFQKIGFGVWGRRRKDSYYNWLPVLEISPFDLADGPVRQQWKTYYKAVSYALLRYVT